MSFKKIIFLTFFNTIFLISSIQSRYIASGSWDKTVKLWDVSSGKLENTFEGHTAGVASVAFSPDGKYIASGSFDKTIKLWDVSSGKLENTFEGHTEAIYSVAFSPPVKPYEKLEEAREKKRFIDIEIKTKK